MVTMLNRKYKCLSFNSGSQTKRCTLRKSLPGIGLMCAGRSMGMLTTSQYLYHLRLPLATGAMAEITLRPVR